MANGNFLTHLANHIGQTVTIFTTSGGESGRGFTGVLSMVNPSFVRLITQIGPAPGCALGNCCDRNDRPGTGNVGGIQDDICTDLSGVQGDNYNDSRTNLGGQRRIDCNGDRGLGSVVDIPVDRIAAFVHNAIGGSW